MIVTGHADVSTAITGAARVERAGLRAQGRVGPGQGRPPRTETGLAQARLSYRSKYESSLDLLRRGEDIYGWTGRRARPVRAGERSGPPRSPACRLPEQAARRSAPAAVPCGGRRTFISIRALRIATAHSGARRSAAPIALTLSRTRGFDTETGAEPGLQPGGACSRRTCARAGRRDQHARGARLRPRSPREANGDISMPHSDSSSERVARSDSARILITGALRTNRDRADDRAPRAPRRAKTSS